MELDLIFAASIAQHVRLATVGHARREEVRCAFMSAAHEPQDLEFRYTGVFNFNYADGHARGEQ